MELTLKFNRKILIAVGVALVALVAWQWSRLTSPAPAPLSSQPELPLNLANPASVNCERVGGKLVLESSGNDGQIGVCYFLDNRQCEEWALFRGECPVGGLKVTGYITAAARFCAITGGVYTVMTAGLNQTEQGLCQFKSGKKCDAEQYYRGLCQKE